MEIRKVPFFNYPAVFKTYEEDFLRIFKDVGHRGAFIMQKDMADFERNLAEYTGAKFCVGLNNATDAILLGLLAAGIKQGDEVLFCSHTFVATAGAIHFAGGVPVPVEAGADHLMDVDQIEKAITKKTKFVVPTQLNGRTCKMDKMIAVAKKHGLKIIEDSAQGLGSKYKGKSAGTFGEAACISFYPAKNLGTLGDSGALLTNNEDIYQQVIQLRDHGRDPKTGEIMRFGYNMRMDNLHGAFLNFLLQKYDSVVARRREVAEVYETNLKNVEEIIRPPAPDSHPDHFDVFQNYEIEAKDRDQLKTYLGERGIGSMVQWGGKAVHQFAGLNLKYSLPFTENLFRRMLLVPLNNTISNDEVKYICDNIKSFYARK